MTSCARCSTVVAQPELHFHLEPQAVALRKLLSVGKVSAESQARHAEDLQRKQKR